MLVKFPTADVEPVKHGHWMGCDGSVISCRCSVCGKNTFNLYEDDVDGYPYCPNCGAKMDEKEQENYIVSVDEIVVNKNIIQIYWHGSRGCGVYDLIVDGNKIQGQSECMDKGEDKGLK